MLIRYILEVSDLSFEELDHYLTSALGSRSREAYWR